MEKEKEESIFHCYSFNLRHFLQSQGFSFLKKRKNIRNNLTYYEFEKSEALDIAIKKWNELKEKSKEENNNHGL